MWVESDTVVWAGTTNGLNRLTLRFEHGLPRVQSVEVFTEADGLPANRINSMVWAECGFKIGRRQACGKQFSASGQNPVSLVRGTGRHNCYTGFARWRCTTLLDALWWAEYTGKPPACLLIDKLRPRFVEK